MPEIHVAPRTYPMLDARPHIDVLVSVDVDKTLTENDIVWSRRYNDHCVAETPHRHVDEGESSTFWDYFWSICAPCFDECLVSPDIILAHEVDHQAREVMRRLIAEGVDGKSVGFHAVTARPHAAIEPTLAWFHKHDLAPLLRGVTFASEKRTVLEELGAIAHVDDAESIHRQLSKPTPSTVVPIFLDNISNRQFPIEPRHHGWVEVETRLRELIRNQSSPS